MSTQTMASRRAYQLADAIDGMALRYGDAERNAAYDAMSGDRAGALRWTRAAHRRMRALMRLTAALRDLPMKEEK